MQVIKPNFLYNNMFNIQKLVQTEPSGRVTKTYVPYTYSSGYCSGQLIWMPCRVQEISEQRQYKDGRVEHNHNYTMYCDYETLLYEGDRVQISGSETYEVIGLHNDDYMNTFLTADLTFLE